MQERSGPERGITRDRADSGEDYDSCALEGLERELKEIEINKASRAIERTQTTWAMCGEKPSKYFLNLQKIRTKNRTIKCLITEDGKELTSNSDILHEEKRFYEDLYTQEPPSSPIRDASDLGLTMEQIPQLSEHSKNELEKEYSSEELRKALIKASVRVRTD